MSALPERELLLNSKKGKPHIDNPPGSFSNQRTLFLVWQGNPKGNQPLPWHRGWDSGGFVVGLWKVEGVC